jgi:hypothetical protein
MGIPTLISTATADDASEVDITSGIDSTYDEYMFVCTDIGPATDNVNFSFQVNGAGESGFNETITSSAFYAQLDESHGNAFLGYRSGMDQAQGTAYQPLTEGGGNGADESAVGILHLFSPASTTYVKHFYARFNFYHYGDYTNVMHFGGYINTTTAIDEISFKMSSGNFDGVIQMFGIS